MTSTANWASHVACNACPLLLGLPCWALTLLPWLIASAYRFLPRPRPARAAASPPPASPSSPAPGTP